MNRIESAKVALVVYPGRIKPLVKSTKSVGSPTLGEERLKFEEMARQRESLWWRGSEE